MKTVSCADLLAVLPPYQDQWVTVTNDQDVTDIITSILQSHREFAGYYDKLQKFFDAGNIESTAENLYWFCKNNIEYREESDKVQSTALPTGILTRGYGDCKHYASFCGGILDAINRATQQNIKWAYVFASYKKDQKTPYHVFIEIQDKGGPIWIDPTPGSEGKIPAWVVRKNIHSSTIGSMALVKNIAGVMLGATVYDENYSPVQSSEAGDIGAATGQMKLMAVGKGLVTVSAALVEIPVAAAIVAAVGVLVGLVGKFFGNEWHYSTQVRWLIQHFQYSVMGQGEVTSDNHIDETYLQDTLNWFTAVLGVPIYDDDRLQVLSGNDFEGRFINSSFEERATEYLKFWDAQQEGVTMARAIEAAQAAETLRLLWPNGPGAWSGAPISPHWVRRTGQATAGGAAAEPATTPTEKIKRFLTEHKTALLISGGLLALYFIFKKDIDQQVQKI